MEATEQARRDSVTFDGLPPVSRLSRDLLTRSILIGADPSRSTKNAPWANWVNLLAAFVLEGGDEDTSKVMRWLERRNVIDAFHLASEFRNERNAARQRIRTGILPDPTADGWFTTSVRDVLKGAADLRASNSDEIATIHILAAMLLPVENAHESDIQRIFQDREELVRIVSVRALEHERAFNRRQLLSLNPEVGEVLKTFEAGISARFLDVCATMELGEWGAPFQYPYLAALHLLESGPDRHSPLLAFMEQRLAANFRRDDLSNWLLSRSQSVTNERGRGIATLERARRIASRVSPQSEVELPHIIAALFAASDDLPPRATPAHDPESTETLEELLGALGPLGDHGQAWAEVVLGTAKRTPVVRDRPVAPGEPDRIDFDRFARPFASMIADADLSLPLAVGVFGQWGAGKSSFMNLVEEHVRSLATRARYQSASGLSAGIVQIKFNAWHYSDVNLWASLVDHIFAELDAYISARAGSDATVQLLSRLATPQQLALEKADSLLQKRRAQITAKQEFEAAKRDLDARKAAVKPSITDVATAVGATFDKELKDAKSDLGRAARRLGLDRLEGKPEELLAAVDTLAKQFERGRGLGQALLFRLGGWKRLLLLFAALLLIPFGFVAFKQWLADATSWNWLTDVSTSLVAASTFISTATAIVLRAAATVTPALDKLSAIKERLDAAVEMKSRELAEGNVEIKHAQEAYAAADAAVQRARIDLDAANEQLAHEYAAFMDETGPQRLRRFVRERASDGTYARHMGLIATIRRDFARLAALLKPSENEKAILVDRLNFEIGARSRVRQAGWNDQDVLAWSEALSRMRPPPPMPEVALEKLMSREEVSKLLEGTKPVTDLASFPPIDRIVLYIDDLDRCPPKTVMQVLEAIHILLGSDLFVVVVGVDLNWLLASVDKSYVQIAASGERVNALAFLEKIFQIPFWVPGMNDGVRKAIIEEVLPKGAARTGSSRESMRNRAVDTRIPQTEPDAPPVRAEAPPLPLPIVRLIGLGRREEEALVNAAKIAGETPRRLKRLARSYLLLRASLREAEIEMLEANEDGPVAIALLLAVASSHPLQWPALGQKVLNANAESSMNSLLSDCAIVIPSDLSLPSLQECRKWIDDVARFTFVRFELAGR